MDTNKPKDKRINIRLDDDTYYAIKKIVEKDLKTDISSYCRSLLWISTLHEASVSRIRNAVKQYDEVKTTEDMEYMITIKNEIEFIEKFLTTMKENKKKFDDFIAATEKHHQAIKKEAKRYFALYNKRLDEWQKMEKDFYGERYETDPTAHRAWEKIEIK